MLEGSAHVFGVYTALQGLVFIIGAWAGYWIDGKFRGVLFGLLAALVVTVAWNRVFLMAASTIVSAAMLPVFKGGAD